MMPAFAIAVFAVCAVVDSLDSRVETVLPTAAEDRYLTIPWRQDLMAARLEAQREGKPLFLWIMNGHPLGCV
jgi:hypothetical protein